MAPASRTRPRPRFITGCQRRGARRRPQVTAPAAAEEQPDSPLAGLVREALAHSPEHAQVRTLVEAERSRAIQAGGLPDPTLTFGIQNDGFDAIRIGEMETSYWQVMVTQPLPFPGKRGRREEAARAQAEAVEARLGRIELSVAAEVERAWLELRLARGQLGLLERLEALWRDAEATVRSRYAVGAVPQSDLIRAQLERTRLGQQRIALEVSRRTSAQALNRLRGKPLDAPLPEGSPLAEAPLPALPAPEAAVADAEERSPDLALARRSVAAAERRTASARREALPDFTLSAGVMPRGSFDPMWTASVGITLPIFSRKLEAVTEGERRGEAERHGEEATRQVVALRAQERHAALEAALQTVKLYREGLLVQSAAAVESTVTQYRVGKVPFASVLEVLRGVIADEGGHLEAVAAAERIAIAAREVSLGAPPGVAAAGGLGGGAVPGASGGAMASSAPASSLSSGGGEGRGEAAAPAGGASSSMGGGM